jgi:hypothetical protein
MARKGFFTLTLGNAAMAACVEILRRKGGVHVSFDVEPRKMGETLSDALAKHAAAAPDPAEKEQGD